jgi:hypothetical protein
VWGAPLLKSLVAGTESTAEVKVAALQRVGRYLYTKQLAWFLYMFLLLIISFHFICPLRDEIGRGNEKFKFTA